MSNSRAIDVANAAVTLLNAASTAGAFGAFTFTAARAYRPNYDLTQQQSNVIVTVIPESLDTNPFNRHIVEELVAIDVGVQQYVPAATEIASCDALMLLVEQIKQQLETASALVLADAPTDCGWQATENNPIFDPEDLQNRGLFTSVLVLHFLCRRAR